MYLLRANHLTFIARSLSWANREAARLYGLGFTVSLQEITPSMWNNG